MPCHLADDDVIVFAAKDSHQTHRFLLAADRVPRQPDAVRIPEVGQAKVRRQLLASENVLAICGPVLWLAILIVECVNDQLPFDFHGDVFFVVKVDAPRDAARRLATGLMQNRVGPQTDNASRNFDRVFAILVLEDFERVFRHQPAQALRASV
jgi:hypothetical protein